jgi:hypothetical protein
MLMGQMNEVQREHDGTEEGALTGFTDFGGLDVRFARTDGEKEDSGSGFADGIPVGHTDKSFDGEIEGKPEGEDDSIRLGLKEREGRLGIRLGIGTGLKVRKAGLKVRGGRLGGNAVDGSTDGNDEETNSSSELGCNEGFILWMK